MNKIIETGRLAANPRYYENNGKKRVYLVLAVPHNYKKEDEERPGVDYIQFIAFNKKAETFNSYLVKGQAVEIEGHIHTGKYSDKYYTALIADKVYFGRKPYTGDNTSDTNKKDDAMVKFPSIEEMGIPEELLMDLDFDESEADFPI